MNVLIGITGSVASIYTLKLVDRLFELGHNVKLVATNSGKSMIDYSIHCRCAVNLYDDKSETWVKLGDKILHIELRKWADVFIIAPCSLNTLAKITNGICDNLLTEIVRAWDYSKPIIICISGNTFMWENEPTEKQINELIERGIKVLPPIEKTLACGDTGVGAMCDHQTIIDALPNWQSPLRIPLNIPVGTHPGAFGVKRKYDIHTGVDLYCKDGEPVYAVEDSEYIDCGWFTGIHCESPWWNDTMFILLRGKSGYILYGETDGPDISAYGREIKAGQLIGYVKSVLPKVKIRHDIPHHSNSMLHIEIYSKYKDWVTWRHGEKRNKTLMNPTPFLKSIPDSNLI